MKEFIDKLISRLEEEKNRTYFVQTANPQMQRRYSHYGQSVFDIAISIVNELAEEYKGKKVNSDLISRSETIKELNEIYLDNPWDDKEDILEKAIGIVEHINCSINASTDCSTKVSEMPTGWIPVSERVPEAGKRYLVSVVWKDEFNNYIRPAVYDAVYGKDGLWHTYDYEPVVYEVIAWQPLPAPFKEGE